MAQTGYTPIQLYYSSTTTNAPIAANLASGELAINITDGKLFYKDNANAVQVIAWKITPTSAGGTGLTSYTAGDLTYYASGTTFTKLGIGTAYQALQVNAGATAPSWQPSPTSVLSAQGDLLYASAANTLARLAKDTTATRYLSNTGASNNPAWAQIDLSNGITGVLPAANGGTGINNSTRTLTVSTNAGTLNFGAASKTLGISNSITLAGTDSTTMTFPSTSASIARTDAAQTFTGLQTFNAGAEIGSTSLAGKISKARRNYYQVSDNRTLTSGTVNFLSIDFGASTKVAAIINICSTAFSPGVSDFSRAETLFVTRDSTGSFVLTSKSSQGDTTGNTVSYSVSGNLVYLTYTYNAASGTQYNNAYVEIVGINATTTESTFTVTVL